LSGNPKGREGVGGEAAQTVNPVQTTRYFWGEKGGFVPVVGHGPLGEVTRLRFVSRVGLKAVDNELPEFVETTGMANFAALTERSGTPLFM